MTDAPATLDAKNRDIARLLLEIAVRVAYILQIQPASSEDDVMESARYLVRSLR